MGIGRDTPDSSGFNGAATSSLRKAVAAVAAPGAGAASMGPQLHRCGKALNPSEDDLVRQLFQWGRNFIVAESLISLANSAACGLLQWGRNFIVAER